MVAQALKILRFPKDDGRRVQVLAGGLRRTERDQSGLAKITEDDSNYRRDAEPWWRPEAAFDDFMQAQKL